MAFENHYPNRKDWRKPYYDMRTAEEKRRQAYGIEADPLRNSANHGTLMDAICNRDKLYFRKAIAPVVASLQDDYKAALQQRNEAQEELRALMHL